MQAALADAFSNSTSQHFGLIYSSQRDQFAAAVPFIRTGLERGEQCVYVANDNAAGDVLDAMRDAGIDLDQAVGSGALRVITERDAYLKEGDFDPKRMLGFFAGAAQAARQAGFAALRATGEMTWALDNAPGADRLLEYEAHLDEALPTFDAEALCQYSQTRFPEETIKGAIQIHPCLVLDGALYENPFYAPPSASTAPPGASTAPPTAAGPTVDRMLQTIREGRRQPSSDVTADRRLDVSPSAVIEANLHLLITPFIDGELPETTAAEVARQIEANPDLTRLVEAQRATKRTVARLTGRHAPPPDLEDRIRRLIASPDNTPDL